MLPPVCTRNPIVRDVLLSSGEATAPPNPAALAVGLLVLGHIAYAVRDPESRVGMRHGSVSVSWAERMHEQWAAESIAAADSSAPADDRP